MMEEDRKAQLLLSLYLLALLILYMLYICINFIFLKMLAVKFKTEHFYILLFPAC